MKLSLGRGKDDFQPAARFTTCPRLYDVSLQLDSNLSRRASFAEMEINSPAGRDVKAKDSEGSSTRYELS
jgi:hypothetical protein